jgi:microcin C transport system substrate-binding protein
MMPVLQEAWWRDRDFDAPLTEPPPTPGPYRIAAAEMGRSVTYARVPDWWGRDLLPARGQYNFDSVSYRVVRDDAVVAHHQADLHDAQQQQADQRHAERELDDSLAPVGPLTSCWRRHR